VHFDNRLDAGSTFTVKMNLRCVGMVDVRDGALFLG